MNKQTLITALFGAMLIVGCGGGGNSSSASKISLDYLKNSTLNMTIQLNNGMILHQVESFGNNTYTISHFGQGVFSCQPSKSNRDFECFYIPTDSTAIKEGYHLSINTTTEQISGDFAYTKNVLDFRDKISTKQFDGSISGEIIK